VFIKNFATVSHYVGSKRESFYKSLTEFIELVEKINYTVYYIPAAVTLVAVESTGLPFKHVLTYSKDFTATNINIIFPGSQTCQFVINRRFSSQLRLRHQNIFTLIMADIVPC
jgi:hypothetical protein